MLKTRVGDDLWLVQQPDHGRLAGYLAAHWGGANGFARPGGYAPFPAPAELRQAVVQAVAEHDNGWWEWEADPPIDPADGWPLGLLDVARQRPDDSLRRWRLGVPRFADTRPYAALLISLHATHLYADPDDALRHPLFGGADRTKALNSAAEPFRSFLVEQEGVQADLLRRLNADPTWAAAVQPEHLYPHLRLLQVFDAVSLFVSFGAQQALRIADVPRASWQDRCAFELRPTADRRIVCDPFPFDAEPLELFLPIRVVPDGVRSSELPLTRLHALPLQTVRFEIVSRSN
jgi:hypothetical protein